MMDDLIKRQVAIDAIPQRIKGVGGESWMMTYRRSGYNDCVDACLDAIRHLPSAQPQRTGRWIEQDDVWDVYYECSACGEPLTMIDGTPWDNGMNFCPNCGADMREDGAVNADVES